MATKRVESVMFALNILSYKVIGTNYSQTCVIKKKAWRGEGKKRYSKNGQVVIRVQMVRDTRMVKG